MQIDTVAIVGVGLIGGSIGMALKKRRLARRVVGVGRRQSSLNEARRLGAIDQGTLKLSRGVERADLTILCTPVNMIAEQAREAAKHSPPHAIITDSGSTKASIVARLETGLPDGVNFVGSHPLAGSEKRGVQEARPDLFDGRVCVVTETSRTPSRALAVVKSFWRSLGARVVTMSPEAHDRALAYTSHLPHLVAAALSLALPEKYYDVVASGFRDTTRIAASDPDLWTAIFLENAGPLLQSLAGYEQTLRHFRRAIQAGDKRRLLKLWATARKRRGAVARSDDEVASRWPPAGKLDTRQLLAARRRNARLDWDKEPFPLDRLSVRTYNIFKDLGILSFGELFRLGKEGLWYWRNVGPTTMREVEAILYEYGVPAERWNFGFRATL